MITCILTGEARYRTKVREVRCNTKEFDALNWAVAEAIYELAKRLGFRLARTSNQSSYSLVRDYINAMTQNSADVTVEQRRVHTTPMLRIVLASGVSTGEAVEILVAALAEQGVFAEVFNGHGYVIDVFSSHQLLERYFDLLEELTRKALDSGDGSGSPELGELTRM